MNWEGVHLLIYVGTIIASIVIVLSRRVAPSPLQRFEASSFHMKHRLSRNQWSVITDIIIQFLQSRRYEINRSLERLRRRTDNASMPLSKSKIRIEKVTFKSRSDHVIKGEWITPKDETDSNRTILYTHGGGFCLCSINTHRHLAAFIGIASKTRVLIFEYRRTPEHRYPSQIHDCIDAYHFLLSQNFQPKNIIFVGDSAGGHLALSVPLHLKDMGESLPGAIAVMSPWTDLSNSSSSWFNNFETDYLPPASDMYDFVKWYLPEDESIQHEDYRISPINGNFTGFPPTYIQTSNAEQLYDDSVRLESKLKSFNVEVEMDIYGSVPHVFQAFGGRLADEAIKQLGRWILNKYNDKIENAVADKFDDILDDVNIDLRMSISVEAKPQLKVN